MRLVNIYFIYILSVVSDLEMGSAGDDVTQDLIKNVI